jgi:hypothetical protein
MMTFSAAGAAVWSWPLWQVAHVVDAVLPIAWHGTHVPRWIATTSVAWWHPSTVQPSAGVTCALAFGCVASAKSWQLVHAVDPDAIADRTFASSLPWHVKQDSFAPSATRR